jgi:hypothetical protein
VFAIRRFAQFRLTTLLVVIGLASALGAWWLNTAAYYRRCIAEAKAVDERRQAVLALVNPVNVRRERRSPAWFRGDRPAR